MSEHINKNGNILKAVIAIKFPVLVTSIKLDYFFLDFLAAGRPGLLADFFAEDFLAVVFLSAFLAVFFFAAGFFFAGFEVSKAANCFSMAFNLTDPCLILAVSVFITELLFDFFMVHPFVGEKSIVP